ncbi:MAG TPA: hypothetical protein VLA75_07960 [Thermoanaerobaculia bacterium]|nr:hypothetical protein [Thermoanaerobaculia bacterium]
MPAPGNLPETPREAALALRLATAEKSLCELLGRIAELELACGELRRALSDANRQVEIYERSRLFRFAGGIRRLVARARAGGAGP